MEYKFIEDLTSDVFFEAYGNSLKEVFEHSAKALFSVVCDIGDIANKGSFKISVKGKDKKDLLYNWLQELIALSEIEEYFLCAFSISSINDKELIATVAGEPMTQEKGGTVVKAVTNYKFSLNENNGKFIASASLDI